MQQSEFQVSRGGWYHHARDRRAETEASQAPAGRFCAIAGRSWAPPLGQFHTEFHTDVNVCPDFTQCYGLLPRVQVYGYLLMRRRLGSTV